MPTTHKLPEQNLEDHLTNSDGYLKDILRAFDDGWDARGVDDTKQLHMKIKATVYQSLDNAVSVLEYIRSLGFEPVNMFGKMDRPSSMTILITVNLENYLNDSFSKVYDFVTEVENRSKSQQYTLNFVLSYSDENLNVECLLSDGFRDISDIIVNG